GLGAGYSVVQPEGGYIMVVRNDGATMNVSVSDPTGGQSIRKTIGDSWLCTTDLLPAFAFDGMRVFIGAPGTNAYYVKFTVTPAGTARGFWTECLGPGVQYQIDPTTMPH